MIGNPGHSGLLRYHKLFNAWLNLRMPLFILIFSFFIFIFNVPAHAALTSKTYVDTKTAVSGANMATAGQIAKYVADGATGEMKLEGTSLATIAGALTVPDILTGTDTTDKLVSAQTFNAAAGGYATTTGTASAYTATISGFVLQDGAKVRLQMHAENNANATLDVNTTGAKNIQVTSGMNIPAYYFPVNGTADFVYKSSIDKWMVVGSSVMQAAPDDIRRSAAGSYRRYSGDTLRRGILSYGGAVVTTGGVAAAYTITDSNNYPTSATYLNAGTKVVAKMHLANDDNATLNLNGMGAAPIFYKGAAITAGLLQADGTYTLVYDGTSGTDVNGKWNIVMSPNAGTIPLPSAECLDSDKSCALRFGKLNPSTGPGQSGTGAEGYYWEVVER